MSGDGFSKQAGHLRRTRLDRCRDWFWNRSPRRQGHLARRQRHPQTLRCRFARVAFAPAAGVDDAKPDHVDAAAAGSNGVTSGQPLFLRSSGSTIAESGEPLQSAKFRWAAVRRLPPELADRVRPASQG